MLIKKLKAQIVAVEKKWAKVHKVSLLKVSRKTPLKKKKN